MFKLDGLVSRLGLVSLLCLGGAAPAFAADVATTPASPAASAASKSGAETLFGKAPPRRPVGWYVASTSGFTSFDGRVGYQVGARGVLLINQQFGVGLAGTLMGTDRTYLGDHEARDVGAYGGIYGQYVLRSNGLLHAYADATVGSGGWCAQTVNDECDVQQFAFVEPTVNLELNIAKNVRLAGGVGYRAAIAVEGPGMSNRSLSGIVARTSLVVGMF